MIRSRNRLYYLLLSACAAGYGWLYFQQFTAFNNSFSGCIIKHTTSIPCPSCGSTRSVSALLNGHLMEAVLWNPFGIVIACVMTVCPIWILTDVFTSRNTLFVFFTRVESGLRQRRIAIPMILLVAINWIWNIYKDV